MRNDERFEIQRAFDLLPHIIGASWTAVWFRMEGIKKPSREEFRERPRAVFQSEQNYP